MFSNAGNTLKTKEEAHAAIKDVLDELHRDHPEIVESAAAAVGMSLGGAASFTALYLGGTIGLSAAGLTSGLATAGAVAGGGMLAGVAVLAAPIVILGVVGYAIAKNRKNAEMAAALHTAIAKLYRIQERLIANAEYFRDELAEIKAYIGQFESKIRSEFSS